MGREDAIWKLNSMLARARGYLNTPTQTIARPTPSSLGSGTELPADQIFHRRTLRRRVGPVRSGLDERAAFEDIDAKLATVAAAKAETETATKAENEATSTNQSTEPHEVRPEVAGLIQRLNAIVTEPPVPTPDPRFAIGVKAEEGVKPEEEENNARTRSERSLGIRKVCSHFATPRPIRPRISREKPCEERPEPLTKAIEKAIDSKIPRKPRFNFEEPAELDRLLTMLGTRGHQRETGSKTLDPFAPVFSISESPDSNANPTDSNASSEPHIDTPEPEMEHDLQTTFDKLKSQGGSGSKSRIETSHESSESSSTLAKSLRLHINIPRPGVDDIFQTAASESGIQDSGIQESGIQESGIQESGIREPGTQDEGGSKSLVDSEDENLESLADLIDKKSSNEPLINIPGPEVDDGLQTESSTLGTQHESGSKRRKSSTARKPRSRTKQKDPETLSNSVLHLFMPQKEDDLETLLKKMKFMSDIVKRGGRIAEWTGQDPEVDAMARMTPAELSAYERWKTPSQNENDQAHEGGPPAFKIPKFDWDKFVAPMKVTSPVLSERYRHRAAAMDIIFNHQGATPEHASWLMENVKHMRPLLRAVTKVHSIRTGWQGKYGATVEVTVLREFLTAHKNHAAREALRIKQMLGEIERQKDVLHKYQNALEIKLRTTPGDRVLWN
ncbi:hypothetical protein BDV12DRAFT_166128 [Aspergillus spectabilis]